MKRRRRQVDYVLLSFFDGIGAAPAILEHTHGKPLAAFAWEIDEACIKLTKDRLPWLRHRGDLTSDDPAAVAAAVKKADPEGKALLVVTAAPPCQDFSRIGQSPGHAGQRGALFLATAEFYWKTRSLLPDRRWAFLFENVVMEPAHSDAVSKALGVDPIMVCASDFGWKLGETRVLSATAIGGAPPTGERARGRRPPVPPGRGGGLAQVAVRHHAGRGRCRPPGTEEGQTEAVGGHQGPVGGRFPALLPLALRGGGDDDRQGRQTPAGPRAPSSHPGGVH